MAQSTLLAALDTNEQKEALKHMSTELILNELKERFDFLKGFREDVLNLTVNRTQVK